MTSDDVPFAAIMAWLVRDLTRAGLAYQTARRRDQARKAAAS